MLDRRDLLASAAAVLAVPASALAADSDGALNTLFDQFMKENLDNSPMTVTSLGLDTGARAYEKSKLDDRSLAALAGDKTTNTAQLKQFLTLDRTKLDGMDAINYDVVQFNLQTAEVANQRYDYGPGGAGAPYIVSQLTGSYDQIPDFLDSQHQIAVK